MKNKPLLATSGSLIVIGIISMLALQSCGDEEAAPPPPPKPPQPKIGEVKLEPAHPFADVSADSGVDLVHFTGAFETSAGDSRYLPECMGPGVVLFDMDGDQDLDLFVPNGSTFSDDPRAAEHADVRSRLYRCDGPFQYTDVTDQWKVDIRGQTLGGAAADYDGDGDLDLLTTGWDALRLLRNEGGRCVDVTEGVGRTTDGWTDKRGKKGPDWSTSAAFFDCDNDGDLDLFVCMYALWAPENDVFESLDGTHKSFAAPAPYQGNTCRLFRNDGKAAFEDITEEAGIPVKDPATGGLKAKSLGVALWDFNADGFLDIVVANDGEPNFLYLSAGPGRYVERGFVSNIAYDEEGRTRAGMGIDATDFYNDGKVGVPIGNFAREPVSLYVQGKGTRFTEESQRTSISQYTQSVLTFGVKWGDMDLDGLPDLVISNGHLEPEIQKVKQQVFYRQPIKLLRNLGKYFRDWSPACGDLTDPIVGRGLALADLDGDGDLDIVAGNNGGKVRFLRNDIAVGHHWLRIRLVGKAPNTQGIGAMIHVTAAGLTQRRLVVTGGSYASQGDLVQTIGLGDSTSVDEVTVTWPDGSKQDVEVDRVDQVITVTQGG